MITADYRGEGSFQKVQKSCEVICERSLTGFSSSHEMRKCFSESSFGFTSFLSITRLLDKVVYIF